VKLLDVTAEFALVDAAEIGFNLRGVPVTYERKKAGVVLSGQEGRAQVGERGHPAAG